MGRIRALVQTISRIDPELNQAFELCRVEAAEVSHDVGDKVLVGTRPLKAKRQELQRVFTSVKLAA